MVSNTYKHYAPPYFEIVEVDFESAVLEASSFSNSSIQNLDEDSEDFTW